MTAPIRFEAVSKNYRQSVAVESVSFEVSPARITGLLGRNGAGKTTMLRILLGLARPTSGHSFLFGAPSTDLIDPRRVGASIDGMRSNPGATVFGELRIWATALGVPGAAIDSILNEIGLTEAADRKVKELSQGMRQRLSLGTALLSDPEIIVLDEPTTGLDPEGIRWMRQLLKARATAGAAVLVSSHLLAEVEDTVDDVVILDTSLLYSGSIDALTNSRSERLETRFFEIIKGGAVRA